MELIQLKDNQKLSCNGIERWPLSKLFEVINLNSKNYIMKKRGHSFWEINHDNLEYIYYDAKKAYLNSVVKEHPDKNNNINKNDNNIKNINIAWQRIKKIFAQHGIINGRKDNAIIKFKHDKYKEIIIDLYKNKNYKVSDIEKLCGVHNILINSLLINNGIFIRHKLKKCVG